MKKERKFIGTPDVMPKAKTAISGVRVHYSKQKRNIQKACFQNYLYGFTGTMVPVAIFIGNPYIIAIALFVFYSFLSVVVNRKKYISNLAKYFYFPFPAALGGNSAYWLGELIKSTLP